MTHPNGTSFASRIADPGPLGLAAFALTTFVLSAANADLFKAEPVVFGLALCYGGIAQILAGMWEFAKGNTFGATAFTSYGAFWLSFWYLTGHTNLSGFSGDQAHHGIGVFLLAWTIFTAYMLVCALRTNPFLIAVFALLTVTFLLLTFGELNNNLHLHHAGGWFGLATAAAAWVTSAKGVYASTKA